VQRLALAVAASDRHNGAKLIAADGGIVVAGRCSCCAAHIAATTAATAAARERRRKEAANGRQWLQWRSRACSPFTPMCGSPHQGLGLLMRCCRPLLTLWRAVYTPVEQVGIRDLMTDEGHMPASCM
jgi:hypothetical protein